MSVKKTTDQFIKEAKEKITDINYDYSKVDYVGAHTKVCIIDPDFGEFWITPDSFLRGRRHKARGLKKGAKERTKSNEQFLYECKETRTDINYDYSKTQYVNARTKVIIIDPDFGEFKILPNDFLSGKGHPGRYGGVTKTNEQFISDCKEKRTDFNFDYSKVEYVNSKTNVTIIDPDYGEFEITPALFLNGYGHPSRTEYGFKKNKSSYYYIHNDFYGEADKAGVSHEYIIRLNIINKSFKKIYHVDEFWKNEISIFFNSENGGSLAIELEKITHTIALCGKPHNKIGYYEKGDGYTETFNNIHRPKVNKAIKKFLAEHEGEYIIERDINGIFGEVIL